MMKKIISILYIAALLVCVLCTPLSAVLIICKSCAVTSLPWIGCCTPLIAAIAVSPILIIAKILLDEKEEK